MKKIAIAFDLDPATPDPPDELCAVCGGLVMGWTRRDEEHLPALCFGCIGAPSARYLQAKGAASWSFMEPELRTALALCWRLEKDCA